MKLADAKPGDVLADKDGALWLKGEHRARCIYEPANPADTGDRSAPPAVSIRNPVQAEIYGPFVRIVPETEAARLQAELDALRAILESGAESTKSASDMLAKVMRGEYQWPSGVAWAVGEAHRRLTGGPPDGGCVRDDLRGLAGKGAE